MHALLYVEKKKDDLVRDFICEEVICMRYYKNNFERNCYIYCKGKYRSRKQGPMCPTNCYCLIYYNPLLGRQLSSVTSFDLEYEISDGAEVVMARCS